MSYPANEIPAVITLEHLALGSDSLAVWIPTLRCHSTGLLVEIEALYPHTGRADSRPLTNDLVLISTVNRITAETPVLRGGPRIYDDRPQPATVWERGRTETSASCRVWLQLAPETDLDIAIAGPGSAGNAAHVQLAELTAARDRIRPLPFNEKPSQFRTLA